MSETAEMNLPNNSKYWEKVDADRKEDKERTREIEREKQAYEERQRERQRTNADRTPPRLA
jgi:hypothetical protein